MPPEMAEKKVKRAHRAYTEGDINEVKLAVSRGTPEFLDPFFVASGRATALSAARRGRRFKDARSSGGMAGRGRNRRKQVSHLEISATKNCKKTPVIIETHTARGWEARAVRTRVKKSPG